MINDIIIYERFNGSDMFTHVEFKKDFLIWKKGEYVSNLKFDMINMEIIELDSYCDIITLCKFNYVR